MYVVVSDGELVIVYQEKPTNALKSILKTQTKTLKSPYMFRSTTIFREHT
jgi:hypothetical protein